MIEEIEIQVKQSEGTVDKLKHLPMSDKVTEILAILGLTGSGLIPYTYFNTGNSSLTDNENFYLGQMGLMSTGLTGFARIPIVAGTVREVYLEFYNAATIGSSESIIVKFVSDDGVKSDTITTVMKADGRHYYLKVPSLAIVVTDGLSYIDIETTLMSINPNAVQARIIVLIEPS